MTAGGYRCTRGESVVTATIDGPVSALDWTYALDQLRKLSDRGTTPGYWAHVHFFSEPASQPRPVAIAECAIVLHGSSKVVVAGAVGTTMRAAVDDLTARLRRRFRDIARRDLARRDLAPLGPYPGDARGGIRHDRHC
jgi:ribosome-associated translation inhibitor RaiA